MGGRSSLIFTDQNVVVQAEDAVGMIAPTAGDNAPNRGGGPGWWRTPSDCGPHRIAALREQLVERDFDLREQVRADCLPFPDTFE
jgi:hypothetical protein